MAKKAVVLDGLLNTESKPTNTGVPQRGAEIQTEAAPAPKKREGEKRLSLALDGATYRRLKLHAAMTDDTHQDILERALVEYLNRVDT